MTQATTRQVAPAYAMTVLTAVYALGYADRSIINLLLDSIKQEFSLSDTVLGLITGLGFTTFQVLLGIPVARWADSGRRITILTSGLLLWSVMTGLSGLATSAIMLAITRMGVGVGESCLTGPSHSILADLYPKERRPRAFSVMSAGGEIGVILALLVGGWVSHIWGWRAAFLVAGLPGILLSAIMYMTFPEPRRGAADGPAVMLAPLPFAETFRTLVSKRSFVLAVLGSMAMGLNLFGMQVWSPAVLRRIYHLDVATVGTLIAGLRAVLAVSGAVAGGWLAERCIQRFGPAWFLRFPAVVCTVSGFAVLGFLTAPNVVVATMFLGLVNLTVGAQLGPVFSAIQTISPARTRAVAAALFVSLTQLFGLGIGSVLVGMISDFLHNAHGASGLRLALILPAAGALAGGVFYWLGGRFVAQDITSTEMTESQSAP